jgi:outer membrane lipoprotein carrier protein
MANSILHILFICLIATAWLGLSAGRETRANTSTQASELTPLIEGLQKKYYHMKGLSADFVQVYQRPDGSTTKESGTVLLKRPRKAKWEYQSPERKLFVSDGKNVYFHVMGEPYASRISIKESGDPQIPFLFLLGAANLRNEFERIELLSKERSITPGNRVLRLVPKRAPEEFKRLLVEVNPTTFEVKRVVIFERNGGRMDFGLTNVRENYVASDAEFSFKPPTGVVIKER